MGELTAVDDLDQNDSHTFTILDDPSGLLEVSGASLRLRMGESLNYEAWLDGLSVEILAEDGGGNQVTRTIIVQITDENDAPTVSGFGVSLNEDSSLALTANQFLDAFNDEDEEDKLRQVKVTLLPTVGQLKLGEDFVFEGQEIPFIRLNDLSFVPDRNFNGRLSFKWTATDGEAFAQQAATTTIIVIPVADPATFIPDTDQIVVDEDAGLQNFNWAVDIRNPDGDPRDLRFVICSNSNEDLFSGDPRVSGGGNLIFTPAPDKNGTAVLQILLTEQPKPEDGDETAVCTNQTTAPVSIIVEPVNDAPTISGTITVTISMTETISLLPDARVTDPDQLDGFNFESGSVDIVISNRLTETLIFSPTLNGSTNITLISGVIYYDTVEVGLLVGQGEGQLRIENLTSFVTPTILAELLQHIVVNVRIDNEVQLLITLNDGGNIGKEKIPLFGSLTVHFINP